MALRAREVSRAFERQAPREYNQARLPANVLERNPDPFPDMKTICIDH